MSANHLLFLCLLSASIGFIQVLDEKDWSFFVFAQQWPPAACLEVPSSKKCLIPDVVVDWSIHGLWPTSDVGYPSFCNESWHFNAKELQKILQPLEAKWPNIFANTSETSFWKHEWDKHGTCSTSLKNFDSEFKYFKRTLELHDKYNIYQFLRAADIQPKEEAPILLQYVENAIKLKFDYEVKFFCKKHKDLSYPILTAIYLCFDKTLAPLDCDKIHEEECTSSHVYYLPFNRTQHFRTRNHFLKKSKLSGLLQRHRPQ